MALIWQGCRLDVKRTNGDFAKEGGAQLMDVWGVGVGFVLQPHNTGLTAPVEAMSRDSSQGLTNNSL